MTLARFTTWTLLVGAGFALLTGSAQAQPALPVKDSNAFSKVTEYRDIGRGGITKDKLNEAKDNFAKAATFFTEVVAHPAVHKAAQDFKALPPAMRFINIDGPEGILKQLDEILFEPGTGPKNAGPDRAVYNRELGAALDAALKDLIEKSAEPVVRVNAARVLAHVCKGGSPAHYPTLTALITSPNTRTEVKYYLFHAAANLLAAYDPNWLKTRNHAAQTEEPKLVGALVKALDDCVTTPSLLLAGLPDDKTDNATPDQLAVLSLVRRQAIKALAQVRFVVVNDPNAKPLYPSYTLARVALGDPALVPAPGPADAAEAVIGLCNMAPVEVKGDRVAPVKYNADAVVEALNAALITFAAPRAKDAFDRRLPWRNYALRITEAMRNWRPLFDPDYDIAQPSKFSASAVPAVVEEFYKEVVPKVLYPMDKVKVVKVKDKMDEIVPDDSVSVDIEWLRKRLQTIRENPKRNTTLFPGLQQTTIVFAPAKK